MSDSTPLRRIPQQERGQRRIHTILDAAAALFAEAGYEATTTNAIAARAGTSIGSVYQFFPNKEAILHAVTARYLEDLRATYNAVLGAEAANLPPQLALGRMVDTLVEFHSQHLGFMAIFSAPATAEQLTGATGEIHQEIVQRVEQMLEKYVPHLQAEQRTLHALVCVHIVKGLLPLSETSDAVFRTRIISEIKALLLAYLESLSRRASDD